MIVTQSLPYLSYNLMWVHYLLNCSKMEQTLIKWSTTNISHLMYWDLLLRQHSHLATSTDPHSGVQSGHLLWKHFHLYTGPLGDFERTTTAT